MPRTLTVAEAALALGIAPSTVRRDVAKGCAGIVRCGESGRGKGALLDLEQYRAWRAGEVRDEHGTLELLEHVAVSVLREHGGQTRALRRHAAFLMLAVYVRAHQALTHIEPATLPEKLRTACAVLSESTT